MALLTRLDIMEVTIRGAELKAPINRHQLLLCKFFQSSKFVRRTESYCHLRKFPVHRDRDMVIFLNSLLHSVIHK